MSVCLCVIVLEKNTTREWSAGWLQESKKKMPNMTVTGILPSPCMSGREAVAMSKEKKHNSSYTMSIPARPLLYSNRKLILGGYHVYPDDEAHGKRENRGGIPPSWHTVLVESRPQTDHIFAAVICCQLDEIYCTSRAEYIFFCTLLSCAHARSFFLTLAVDY